MNTEHKSRRGKAGLAGKAAVGVGLFWMWIPVRGQPHASEVAAPAPAHCASCHSCDAPTKENSCLRACPRPSKNGPDIRNSPAIVLLDELEDRYLPVPFDHKGHAEMAEMTRGCVLCHHGTPEGSAHPACKTCHEVRSDRVDIRKPGLKGAYHRQCLSCHREWNDDAKCEVCHRAKTGRRTVSVEEPTPDDIMGRIHPPIAQPGIEVYQAIREDFPPTQVVFRHDEHARTFGLHCAACHREDNCGRCHEAGKKHTQKVRSLDEHHQPCQECHRNDACDRCHFAEGSTPPPPFDHARTGWPLNRHHRDTGCRTCHAKVPFEKIDSNCNSCHSDWAPANFEHAVTGQRLDEVHQGLDCEACHADRAFNRPPTCNQCHEPDEGIAFPAQRPGPVDPVVAPQHGGGIQMPPDRGQAKASLRVARAELGRDAAR